MDKQKQIEEMAKYICGYVQSKELDSLKLISWKSGNPLFLGVSHNYGVAEYLHDAGYRKIPENEEKLEKQVRELDKELNLAKSVLSYDDERPLEKWAEHLRKETAEKFAEMVLALFHDDMKIATITRSGILRICKEITGGERCLN